MIKFKNLTKIYNSNGNTAIGLNNINLSFRLGEFVGIVGPSGSGKTTLLNVASGMDSYEEGDLILFNESTAGYTQEDFENYRRNNVAFIFQNYQLIDSYTVLDNVVIELLFKGISQKEAAIQAKEILEAVGMSHRLKNKASKLSGGEKQRVVIARALASSSNIIACDEPTGNLDTKNSNEIIKILKEISTDKLILFVTHEPELIQDVATRMLTIKDGVIESDIVKTEVEVKEDVVISKKTSNTKVNFFIGLKNLFSTPKRTLLLFLLFLCSSFYLSVSIGSLNTRFDLSTRYDQIYSNPYENRVVVYGDTNYNAIRIDNDSYLDEKILITSDNKDLSFFEQAYISFFHDTITYGKECSNSNEVVIQISSYVSDAIDDNALDNNSYKINIFDEEYTVVGVIVSDMVFDNHVYFYNNEVPYHFSNYESDLVLTSNDKKQDFYVYEINDNVLLTLPNGYNYTDINLTIGNLEIEITQSNVLYTTDEFISINSKYIEEVCSNNVYRSSYIFEYYNEANTCYNSFKNSYTTIFPANFDIEINLYYYLDLFSITFKILNALVIIIVLGLVVSFISFIILKSTIKDFTIMRIIGLSKRDIYIVILFQISLCMLVSYVCVLGVSSIVNSLEYNILTDTFKDVILLKNVLLTTFIVLFLSFIISNRHHKKMFKTSASNNLRGGDLL